MGMLSSQMAAKPNKVNSLDDMYVCMYVSKGPEKNVVVCICIYTHTCMYVCMYVCTVQSAHLHNAHYRILRIICM